MADATGPINTPQRLTKFDQYDQFGMETSATVYEGTGAAIGSDGKVVHASQAGALFTLGVAQKSVVSAAAGDLILTGEGIFRMANDAGHLLSIADRFGPCYWTDDQTVGTDSSKLLAGVVYDVDASGVWVIMGPMLVGAASVGALLAANNLDDVLSVSSAAHNLGLGTADSPTFTGLTLSAVLHGLLKQVATKTTTYGVVSVTDSNSLLQTSTDGEVFNLPAVASGNKGMSVTVQNIGADGAALVKIEPNGTNTIKGQIGTVEFGGVASKGIWNTKATAKQGDHATLVSDGTSTWWVVGGIGVWASES